MLGLALALAALAAPLAAYVQDDVQADFQEGVDLYRRGRKQEALAKFQAVLAADPTNEEAYELWKASDQRLFNDLLVEGGEYTKITKRLLERATLGRVERRNDREAINDLVQRLKRTDDALERHEIILELSSQHGEYAVPRLLAPLADAGDADWRVMAMHTLTEMGTDVVLPLIAALDTGDVYQRANVAMVLGYVGDPRAAAYLQHLSETDEDTKVQRAAGKAAMECGASGSTLDMFLKLGDDYHHARENVLRSFDYSDVVWSWEDGSLEPSPVPRAIYNNVLAKRAYYHALDVAPESLDALAGVARECTDIVAKLGAMDERGEDVGDLLAQARVGALAVPVTGIEAIDRALSWAVVTDDASSGVHLIRTLGRMAARPTPGLESALDSDDGAMRGEAAVALGQVALTAGEGAPSGVVGVLGENVGREVVRIAVVIDGNAERASATVAALEAQGVLVNHRGNGARGVDLLSQVPGLDVIVVGDDLPDMTIDQVVVAANDYPGTSDVPIVLMTGDEELGETWSDRVAGVSTGAEDLAPVQEVFEQNLSGDRAQADELAARSGSTLAHLAMAAHTDIGAVLDQLTGPLAHRDDAVTVPCMEALAAAGTPDQLAALAGVLADGERSDEARVAAAEAMGGIFARHPVTADAAASVEAVTSDAEASIEVRQAAARALGRVQTDDRASLVRGVRVEVRADG